MTQIDLGNIRINWRGAYDAKQKYVRHDAVAFKGSSFIAKRNVTNVIPIQGADWDLMAAGSDQLTQEGDLLTHDGNKPIRLIRGGNAQILQMSGNRPTWQDQALDPARRVWKLGKVNRYGSRYTRIYLMANGLIKACGMGSNYSNGNPSGKDIYLPSVVATEDSTVRFVDVFSGGQQHYGLTAEGQVYSWGYNNYGQLGHGDTVNRAIAKRIDYFVKNKIKIARIIPGQPNYYDYGVAYFLTTDGRVYACGYGGNGNLGTGTMSHQYTPVRCGALENIIDIGVSSYPYSVHAIDKNGALWVWGRNNNGQLGLGDTTDRSTPLLNAAMKNIVKAIPVSGSDSSGENLVGCGFALRSDGSIWAAGYNGSGQLGLGDTTSRSSFTQIPLSESVIDISITDGRYGPVGAVTQQGHVYLWGANGYGQLGTGDTSAQYKPFKPKGAFQGKVTRVQIGGGCSWVGSIIQYGN
uniref:RCC1 domain-containing protein n=1 Tax=Bartonella queenslandensis TaxID=481138 RepID=UPI0012EA73D5